MRGRVGGRGLERDRERNRSRGVDTRGDMLRYGSGRSVSTTTTTTEDSPESFSEVRSPMDSKSPCVSPRFSPSYLLLVANRSVFCCPPTCVCAQLF